MYAAGTIFGGTVLGSILGVQIKRRMSAAAVHQKPLSGVFVCCNFDSGNIEVVDSSDCSNIQLKMRSEPYTQFDGRRHSQWFHFQVCNAKGKDINLRILNAGEASFGKGYEGYWAFVSYDRKNWTRVRSSFDDKVLSIEVTPEANIMWVAYFPPFSYEQHMSLIGESVSSPHCEYMAIGQTVQGRPIDCLKIGTGKNICWIHARTHPGETQAEWWMAGFLPALLSDEPAAEKLREQATLYVIPSMNPDGAIMGHLRTNANGANLNREWCDTPSRNYCAPHAERSPEVFWVKQKMKETGCDFYFDVHGDEAIPANFIMCGSGCPNWSPRLEHLFEKLGKTMTKMCEPYFQNGIGYDNGSPGNQIFCIASKSRQMEFDCLSATLEMPYKQLSHPQNMPFDHTDCAKFGAQFVPVLLEMQDDLRKEFKEENIPEREPWVKAGYKSAKWVQPDYENRPSSPV